MEIGENIKGGVDYFRDKIGKIVKRKLNTFYFLFIYLWVN